MTARPAGIGATAGLLLALAVGCLTALHVSPTPGPTAAAATPSLSPDADTGWGTAPVDDTGWGRFAP
ncbi:hypothetical protein JK359_11920 [Streptomyces actinomycinicus]|uniref:Uncharacterized protein n=1 Tax=Streptomyces actinomycinicus TaxID=1695166 RepID=A0A937JPQ1_9ACTN|nr:hypothetical protein [Streptomyces actinomycinicus]MBL1082678.1 hypothetical protein [Streptomyces actinomycinicus]